MRPSQRGGAHVVRNGHADGLQRDKCRTCGRTFNALTSAPLARLRQRGKWLAQARALADGLSVRRAAAQMGVHRTTAFRWRHRFLQLPATVRASALAVCEGDETYKLCSYGAPGAIRPLYSSRNPTTHAICPGVPPSMGSE
jgi:transposase-like protein